MYQVLIENNGEFYYLRGTTWTFEAMRGQVFESIEQAEKALLTAKEYTKPKLFKTASIIAA